MIASTILLTTRLSLDLSLALYLTVDSSRPVNKSRQSISKRASQQHCLHWNACTSEVSWVLSLF